MLPTGYIVHHVDHRTRIYVPSKRKQPHFFSEVEKSLQHCNQIDRVKTNPLTGTVLVYYKGNLSVISEFSEKHGLFTVQGEPDHPHSWTSEMFRRIDRLDTKIIRSTDGSFNLASTTALGLLGLSFFQFYRKQILPTGTALLFDAYVILKTSGKVTERRLKTNRINSK